MMAELPSGQRQGRFMGASHGRDDDLVLQVQLLDFSSGSATAFMRTLGSAHLCPCVEKELILLSPTC